MVYLPKDRNDLVELKKNQHLNIGKFKGRNLQYGIPEGVRGKIFRYYIELGEGILLPTSMIEESLRKANVDLYWVERLSYNNLETGILSVCAGSNHRDREISLKIDGISLILRTVSGRIKRKKKDSETTKSF